MDKMDSLRAGAAEMRSVAQRLIQWANDLETSISGQKGPPAAVEEKKSQLTLPEVRAILAEKCAKGFGNQVKALIESYGVVSLKDVPPEEYQALVEAVKDLGEPLSAASGGNPGRGEVTRNKRSVRGTVATIEGAEPEVQDAR